MGYDLYGVNPVGYNKKDYPVLVKWEDRTLEERQEAFKENDKLCKKYFDEMYKRDSATGQYFRANVWFWRQIWVFTCKVCKDVMTKEDKEAGDSNDGIEIDGETCIKMIPLMKEAIKNGDAAKYEKDVTEYIDSVKKDDNGWIKDDDQFWANYPFKAEFFEEFVDFVENSGGFTIY